MLFNITNLSTDKNSFRAEITFNPADPVFTGHFPGRPIVPGVMLVEIASATASKITGKELIVKEASVIKFLQVIDPTVNTVIRLDGSMVKVDDINYKADLSFSSGEIIFAKMKGILFS